MWVFWDRMVWCLWRCVSHKAFAWMHLWNYILVMDLWNYVLVMAVRESRGPCVDAEVELFWFWWYMWYEAFARMHLVILGYSWLWPMVDLDIICTYSYPCLCTFSIIRFYSALLMVCSFLFFYKLIRAGDREWWAWGCESLLGVFAWSPWALRVLDVLRNLWSGLRFQVVKDVLKLKLFQNLSWF